MEVYLLRKPKNMQMKKAHFPAPVGFTEIVASEWKNYDCVSLGYYWMLWACAITPDKARD